MLHSSSIAEVAPVGESATRYDQDHLALYAALIDADDDGRDWREVAATLMGLDPARADVEACWRSHLERARWIVGEGLGSAVAAFGQRSVGAE